MAQRIVFDCERMKYFDTGLYHYDLNLAQHLLSEADPLREEICLFTPQKAQDRFGEEVKHITQHSLQKFFMPSLSRYDIWHSTFQDSHYVPRRNRKIKVVLTIHDLNFIHEKKNSPKKAKYLRHLQQHIDRADAIVCISDFCRRDVLTHCETGNKPIHVIHNGTNTLKSPELYTHSYKPGGPFLFSLGVICRKKNFHVLLPLLQPDPNLELVIAGRPDDGNYLDFIHQSAREMQVENQLRILGSISEHEKSWYYQNCYAFALPSIAEGFGLPVTEAMSAGKPVFLSDRTALPEIGSTAAFYFSDFNALHMQKVFRQGMEQYENLRMEPMIRQRSEQFNWTKAARAYLEVYRSLY